MITGPAIRSLRLELESGGVFESHAGASSLKFVAMLVALAACIAAAVFLPWWCALFLAPLAAVPAVTAAMIGHEASHGSFSTSKLVNQFVLHLAFPVLGGLGALHWDSKHNRNHHGQPNVVGLDQDLDLWPMAMSSVDHAGSGRFRRWLQRGLQGYLFWPLTMFLAFTMRFESWRHLVRRVRASGLDRAVVIDAASMTLHYVLWLVLPSLWLGFVPVLLFYVGMWLVAGLLLALIFAPAHMGLPIVSESGNRWLHQLETTRNLRVPRWLSWFFVGLDYQVEHHFFPRIPHRHLPEASRITRAWCARNGAPHHSIDYGAAVADVTRFMFVSWKLEPVPGFVVPRGGPVGIAPS